MSGFEIIKKRGGGICEQINTEISNLHNKLKQFMGMSICSVRQKLRYKITISTVGNMKKMP